MQLRASSGELGVGLAGVWFDCAQRRWHLTVHKGKGSRPVSGAVDTWLGLDGSLLRRGGVRGRRFRLRNGLGTFALVVIVADPARVRLFAVGTKLRAHRNPLAYRDVRSERLDFAPLRPLGL